MDKPKTYILSFHSKPGYLHIIVTGQNSLKNVESYLQDVMQECKSKNYSKVLVEERLEGPRLGMMDVFRIASESSITYQGSIKAMAYVDVNGKGDLMKFAETVAVNRSARVAVFLTIGEAEEWLMSKE